VDVHDLADGQSEKRFEQKVAKVAKGVGEEHGDGAPWLQRTRSGSSIIVIVILILILIVVDCVQLQWRDLEIDYDCDND